MSGALPGGACTTTRTGRTGYCCASAAPTSNVQASAAITALGLALMLLPSSDFRLLALGAGQLDDLRVFFHVAADESRELLGTAAHGIGPQRRELRLDLWRAHALDHGFVETHDDPARRLR